MQHPYKTAPARSFWTSISRGFDPARLIDEPVIRPGERVASAGSCFAANIVPYLERAGIKYVRTETVHPAFRKSPPEAFGYANFSAAYGNIYTTRQLLQLLKRALGTFSPAEDRWKTSGSIVDPFRPGLRYTARSDVEFEHLRAQHLARVLRAFRLCDVCVFTLGLTEMWESAIDGAALPACPGTIAGEFDPTRHRFRNLSASEVRSDLEEIVQILSSINRRARLVLTVSPVPLVATATGGHVLTATTYSKSVLRVAASEAAAAHSNVAYFPAYEIVTGPQAPDTFFEADRRNVSKQGVDAVMHVLFPNLSDLSDAEPKSEARAIGELAQGFVDARCEEEMAGP